MRPATACTACRARRRKCEIPLTGQSCTSCTIKGLPCSAGSVPPQSSSPQGQESSSVSPPLKHQLLTAASLNQILSPALCTELVNLYFDFIHDKYHSLFHRPTVIEDVQSGCLPGVLLCGMAALAARFSSNPLFLNSDPRERGRPFADECYLLFNLRDISLTTVQAAVLLGAISVTEGQAGEESVFYCIANRIAQLLDLPRRPTADQIEFETNIRVWWTLCMIDVWSSDGLRLPRQLIHDENVPLPMDEAMFLQLCRGERQDPNAEVTIDPASSLLAQMVKLNRILADIHEVNQRAVAGRTTRVVLDHNVKDVIWKLDTWLEDLPEYMHDTPANLARYAAQGLGRIFVTLYMGYYHYGQLLVYQFLHEGCHGSTPSARFYAKKCRDYAAGLCTLLYTANATPGCEVLYTMVGHILVIASTVQIHTLLYSIDEEQIRIARSRLERNFEILIQLRRYWPTLDICFTRLRAFHKACRTSMETSFRLDQWMLSFLYEFGKPMDDKYAEQEDDDSSMWFIEKIGIIPSTAASSASCRP